MDHDHAFVIEDLVIAKGTAFKGAAYAQQAKDFADRLGQYLFHYDPVLDTWQLTDGEIYTTQQIINENAAAFVAERKAGTLCE